MNVSIVEDMTAFEALEGEWNSLLQQSSANTIFLTWEWISSWLEIYSSRYKLFVIVVRNDENKLIGLAPLYISNYKLLFMIKLRMLRILGDRDCGSEYPNWIALKDKEKAVYEIIAKALCEHEQKNKWDCIWIPNLSGWNGSYRNIVNACNRADMLVNQRERQFGYFVLPATYNEYEKSLSSNRRSQLRRQRKKMFVDETIEIACCEDEKDLPIFLEWLFDLHHKRRLLVGDIGTFKRKPLQMKFYQSFTRKALQNNWLFICVLKAQGTAKAIQLGYIYNNVYLQLQEGFEPDFLSGAGNVLRAENIRHYIEAGLSEYDFLEGYTEHKRRWLAEARTGYDLFLAKNTFINQLIFNQDIWPTGRFLRPV